MIQEHRNCQCEDRPCCGCDNGTFEVEENEVHGWAGDGSGEDDFADYNANEADDYRDEGGEDSYLDSSWEDRFEMDMGD
jgi:hypothetical protein